MDPLLNSTGKAASRLVPEGILGDIPNLRLPTDVPFVQPVKPSLKGVRPGLFNGLAQSLGSGGLGLNSLAGNIAKANKARQEREEQQQYSQGLVDATKRAAATRDLYSDYVTNGLQPANANPSYQLGWQAGSASNLSAQYRNELYAARQNAPLASPEEIQDPIKTKYLDLIQDLRPEVVRQFFIEPSILADVDDVKAFNAEDSKAKISKGVSDYSAGLSATLSVETDRFLGKRANIQEAKSNIVEQANSNLYNNYSLDIPISRYVDSTIESTVVAVKGMVDKNGQPATLSEKRAILSSLREIKDPSSGKPLFMTNLDYAKKVVKAEEDLVKDAHEMDKLNAESLNAGREADTGKLDDLLLEDVTKGTIRDQAEYYREAKKQGWAVDPNKFNATYSSFNSQNTNDHERKSNEYSVQIQEDINNNLTPAQLTKKWGPLVRGGFIDKGTLRDATSTARTIEHQTESQNRSLKIPDKYLNDHLKTINAGLRFPQAYSNYTNYSPDTVVQAVTSDLRLKYGQMVRLKQAQWYEKNPQASESEIINMTNREWEKVQPLIFNDIKRIQNQEGGKTGYRKIVSPGSIDLPKVAPKKLSPATYSQGYSWAVNPKVYQSENELFKQRKGAKYQALYQSLAKKNRLDLLDQQWKFNLNNPNYMIEALRDKGFPTYLGGPVNGKP